MPVHARTPSTRFSRAYWFVLVGIVWRMGRGKTNPKIACGVRSTDSRVEFWFGFHTSTHRSGSNVSGSKSGKNCKNEWGIVGASVGAVLDGCSCTTFNKSTRGTLSPSSLSSPRWVRSEGKDSLFLALPPSEKCSKSRKSLKVIDCIRYNYIGHW